MPILYLEAQLGSYIEEEMQCYNDLRQRLASAAEYDCKKWKRFEGFVPFLALRSPCFRPAASNFQSCRVTITRVIRRSKESKMPLAQKNGWKAWRDFKRCFSFKLERYELLKQRRKSLERPDFVLRVSLFPEQVAIA